MKGLAFAHEILGLQAALDFRLALLSMLTPLRSAFVRTSKDFAEDEDEDEGLSTLITATPL